MIWQSVKVSWSNTISLFCAMSRPSPHQGANTCSACTLALTRTKKKKKKSFSVSSSFLLGFPGFVFGVFSDTNVQWEMKFKTSDQTLARRTSAGYVNVKWFVFRAVFCHLLLFFYFFLLISRRQTNPFGFLLIENKAAEAEHWTHTQAARKAASSSNEWCPFIFSSRRPSFECFGLMHRDCF